VWRPGRIDATPRPVVAPDDDPGFMSDVVLSAGMETADIDDLDERIIHELQRDARHTSASDIADTCDVSPSTVRKRLQGLEDAGVIRGYHPNVDYERAGYKLRTLVVCTAPIPEREELAREVQEVDGVVAVREVMTGSENLKVEVVGRDGDDLSRIGRDLDALGCEVEDEDLIRNEYENPFQRFATPTDEKS
jgi:DNA-binding Lrp family transcriptional regulator